MGEIKEIWQMVPCAVCGSKRAVLIQYPNNVEPDPLCTGCYSWLIRFVYNHAIHIKPRIIEKPVIVFYNLDQTTKGKH